MLLEPLKGHGGGKKSGLFCVPSRNFAFHRKNLINKLVCGGRSGALWLPSHHPGGCCTLVVDEEIATLLCKAL